MTRLSRAAFAACLAASALSATASPRSSHALAGEARPRPGDSSSPASPAFNPAVIDAFVKEAMAKRHVPGASVAVVRDGKILLARGYGLANLELGVPAAADTVYQLASVTKTFTATAVMMLVKDGKVGLDDRIVDRLPGLPAAWKDVTVRHLLTHTSGIKSYTSTKDFEKQMRRDFTRREILDLVAKEPLEFAPGEKWDYCNTGYFLLGMLIEKAASKPYAEFMAERVFGPLGMSRTRTNDLRAVIPGRAQGYEWDGKAFRNGEYVSPTQPFAAGMLVSTVDDLVKWDAALRDHTLLDAATLEAMWQPAPLPKGGKAQYGFGWGVSRVNGHRRISHGGGISGFSTELMRFPDDGLTVIVLTNAEGGAAGPIAAGIAGRVLPALAEKPAEPIVDNDAPTTGRLRKLFEGALKGELDPEPFTEQARELLVPRIREDKDRLASMGAVKSFRLVERTEKDGALLLRYRVDLENAKVRLLFALDKAGKIQGIGLQPED
ncbi:Penicillin-binding protein 4* [Aquisphaera giovannonii]|uniref:Penicillin-binding protein 4 n=1 Tax=Aquisphaera giovannonii TaxID=406548 RepID=A0A5B9WDL0_9BACT|nr:serine hydrolase domain-containing protein [Aquisphaera giovannonii]QEH38597.1 Penicillin-binding protein 4* [Aquisphaera giovannonii]